MGLRHSEMVSNLLLSPSFTPKLVDLLDLSVRVDRPSVGFIGHPPSTSTLIAVFGVVGMRSIFKMPRVDALPVVALVAADLRPSIVPQEEGKSVRKDPLLVSSEFSVASLMETTAPLPTSRLGLDGSVHDVALIEHNFSHADIVPYVNG